MTFVFAPERYNKGMQNFVEMIHRGGITTVIAMVDYMVSEASSPLLVRCVGVRQMMKTILGFFLAAALIFSPMSTVGR